MPKKSKAIKEPKGEAIARAAFDKFEAACAGLPRHEWRAALEELASQIEMRLDCLNDEDGNEE